MHGEFIGKENDFRIMADLFLFTVNTNAIYGALRCWMSNFSMHECNIVNLENSCAVFFSCSASIVLCIC